jgi:hypothetical protein
VQGRGERRGLGDRETPTPSTGFHDGRRGHEQRWAEVRKKLVASPPEEIRAVPLKDRNGEPEGGE